VPGWSAVLALSQVLTGSMVPALGAVAALTVLGMYLLALEAGGRRAIALVAAAIAALTPVLLIQSAVFLSYQFAFCAGVFASAALLRGARAERALPLVAGGALLGVVLLTRTLDAVLWGAPFVVLVLCASPRTLRAARRRVLGVALGFAPLALALLAYDRVVTGRATDLPITTADPLNTFGFGTRRIMVGSPLVSFEPHQAIEAVGQNFWRGREWVIGSLAGVALALAGAYLARRRVPGPPARTWPAGARRRTRCSGSS